MSRPFGALVLAVMLLAGCAETGWLAGAPNESEPPLPQRKPSDVGSDSAGGDQQALVAPGSVESEPTTEIGELVGLDFAAVRTMLGNPALEEIQPPATVWAYNGRGCVLNIFFYPDVDGGSYRALTYQVKGAEQTEELPQRCFVELLQDGEKTGTN